MQDFDLFFSMLGSKTEGISASRREAFHPFISTAACPGGIAGPAWAAFQS